ncbi:MAG: hypothetical protein QXT98_00675 [Archaeoglobaceae archaeon]
MSGYEKFLTRGNVPLPETHLKIINEGKDIPSEGVLMFSEKDKLLEEGYHLFENGFHHFKDGSAYVACLTKMPKVSIEMLYWWFWWHSKEGIRYRIWYPEKHFDVHTDSTGFTHYVTEDIGTGKQKLIIQFLTPLKFGFDTKKLENVDFDKVAIICARVGIKRAWFTVWHTKMCHFVRKAQEGVELRSRFWIGERLEVEGFGGKILSWLLNRPIIKRRVIPRDVGKHMFHHCAQEYHNLSEILPEIYNEESQKRLN